VIFTDAKEKQTCRTSAEVVRRQLANQPMEPMVTRPKLEEFGQARCRLLSVEEVAELLRVPVSWVYDRTRSRGVNRIPGFRLGKYWRFDESEVVAWLERQRSGGRVSA
jgi:excisionase family DNA binding protein